MASARPSRLDPAVAALIKALARGDAERDFKAAMEEKVPNADRHLRPIQLGPTG